MKIAINRVKQTLRLLVDSDLMVDSKVAFYSNLVAKYFWKMFDF